MASSYFNRVAGRAPKSPVLLPARPLSTLWKSARLEQPIPFAEAASPGGKAAPAPVLRRPAGAAAPAMAVVESRVANPVDRDAVALRRPADPEQVSLAPNEPPKVLPLRRSEPAPAPAVQEKAPLPAESPGRAAAQKTAIAPSPIDLKTRLTEEPPAPRREPAFDHASRTRQAQAETPKGPADPPLANSIQIGRIEVQVVPPPAPARRVSSGTPRARLARGYSFWQG
jgi:hypothetical protein